MKKLTFLFVLALIAVCGNAQHTLSFNQALLVSSSTPIPAGHVFKVMSCNYSSTIPFPACATSASSGTSCKNASLTDQITINGTATTVRAFVSTTNGAFSSSGGGGVGLSSILWEHPYPIWLPGDVSNTIAPGSGVSSISVIDFIVN